MDSDDLDTYPGLLELLDEGRLPVVVFLAPGLVYYRSFEVSEDSPVRCGSGTEREESIVLVMRFTMEEGVRDAPDR